MPLATRKGSPTPGNRATDAANKGVVLGYARRRRNVVEEAAIVVVVVVVAGFYPKQIEFDILKS